MFTYLAGTLERSVTPICFGPICPGLPSTSAGNATVGTLIGNTLGKLIMLAFVVGALFSLFFLLWGALDWIMSEGDKEKLSKAQGKIRNAIIGILLMVASLAIFGIVTGDILGIFTFTRDGWKFNLPTLAP